MKFEILQVARINCFFQLFVEKQQSQSYTVSEVLSDKVNRKALMISIGCMFFQQMSGINVVIFYMTDIFKSTGSTMNPNICTIVVGAVQVKRRRRLSHK